MSKPSDNPAVLTTAGRAAALADPTRLAILDRLTKCAAMSVKDATAYTGLKQPTVSHHMRKLLAAGYVTRFKDGVWSYYSATPAAKTAIEGLQAS